MVCAGVVRILSRASVRCKICVFLLSLLFSLSTQPNERLRKLEDKIKILEQEKAIESCANALAVLRRHLNRPPSLFDRHEAVELLETLVRLARTQAHDKADEYAAALDEVKARQASIEPDHLQRLMLGLIGDPLRAKMAKEAASILKGMSKASSSNYQVKRPLRQSSPYSVQCYNCHGWGHIARNCKSGRGGGRGRGRQ